MISVRLFIVQKCIEGLINIIRIILLSLMFVNMLMITQTPKTYGMYIQAEPDSSKFLLAISMAKWAFWVSLVGLVFTSLRLGCFLRITQLKWKLIKPSNPPIAFPTIQSIKNELSWWKKPMADITYVSNVLLFVGVILAWTVMYMF